MPQLRAISLRQTLSSLLLIVMLAGCAKEPTLTPIVQPVGSGGASAPAGRGAAYQQAECPSQGFRIPNAECGYLTVPEDRSATDGQIIRLSVMIIKNSGQQDGTPIAPQPDPLLLLVGSSGGRFLRGFSAAIGEAMSGRALILMDQRGSGRSEPTLDCPELSGAANAGRDQALFDEERVQLASAALQTCRQRWTAAGISLQNYTTAASAADLEDLRAALGYAQWNIYANNAGANLAYALMRDYPEGLRSVTIDSTPPADPNRLAEEAANTQAALSDYFRLCAADPICNDTYPDIESRFYHIVENLNAAPRLMEVENPGSGTRGNVLVSGDVVLQMAINALFSWDERVLTSLPRMVLQLEKDQTGDLKNLLGMSQTGLPLSGGGLAWMNFCTETAPLIDQDKALGMLGGVNTQLAEYYQKLFQAELGLCPAFDGLLPPPDAAEAVHSSVPTLAVFASLSPSSSRAWTEDATAKLDKKWIVEFKSPSGGAMVSGVACASVIMKGFLANPTTPPDASCADQPPTLRWITFQQN